MRRVLVLCLVVLVVGGIAAPTLASQGVVEKIKETYSIPEDLAEIEDPGELNHGCSGGEYTLVDGVFKKSVTTVYSPSAEAWLAGDSGATMTVSGKLKHTGLWNVDTQPEARFDLRGNNLRYEAVFGTDGSETVHFEWSGRFVDAASGVAVEWWEIDATFVDGVLSGTWDGTCSP